MALAISPTRAKSPALAAAPFEVLDQAFVDKLWRTPRCFWLFETAIPRKISALSLRSKVLAK
jgi:hypothetical protein